MLEYLPRCCASVRDQVRPGIEVEHIVVDGGSTDGTVKWLNQQPGKRFLSTANSTHGEENFTNGYRFTWISEPDQGMYDAINKGWDFSTGSILSWLNCDEQYLPSALETISSLVTRFRDHDFYYGSALLVKPDGKLIAYRKPPILRTIYICLYNLNLHSSSLFIRRNIFDFGCRLDPTWKIAGDAEWLVRVLNNNFKGKRINKCVSAFTITGSNLANSATASGEGKRLQNLIPQSIRNFRSFIFLARRIEKLFTGCYFVKNKIKSYDLYIKNDTRDRFIANNIDFRWRQ